ncbi:helix-turn-helix domain-containing protein [Paenibacillus wenxiniae]|uniref:AraC family transcriptional regulator n=1 Tax=Paenibacillus wenxiniae TaxID=1636843 RepID=A0ABW4RPH3_9BACL
MTRYTPPTPFALAPLARHSFEENNPLAFMIIDIDADHSYQQHAHDFYEIIYISEGSGLLLIEKQCFQVHQGELFFIPPGITHMLQKPEHAQEPLQMMNCLLKSEVLCPEIDTHALIWDEEFGHMAAFFRQTESWLSYRQQNGELARILYGMHINTMNKPPGYRHKQYILLLDLLHTLYVQHQVQFPHTRMDIENPVEFTLGYIRMHYRQPVKLEELCDWLAISPRHVQRLLKQATGFTFIQLLQHCRVLRSCELLLETDWNVQRIAEEVGVHDMKYFYRIFKERCHITPSRFRIQHRQVTEEAAESALS